MLYKPIYIWRGADPALSFVIRGSCAQSPWRPPGWTPAPASDLDAKKCHGNRFVFEWENLGKSRKTVKLRLKWWFEREKPSRPNKKLNGLIGNFKMIYSSDPRWQPPKKNRKYLIIVSKGFHQTSSLRGLSKLPLKLRSVMITSVFSLMILKVCPLVKLEWGGCSAQ